MLNYSKKIIAEVIEFLRFFRRFYYPNYSILKERRVIYRSRPKFRQYTLCSGKGSVAIGEGCSFGYKLGGFYKWGSIELQSRYTDSRIIIGDNVATNNNVFICAANLIKIDKDSLIGQNVTIMDHEAHGISPSERRSIGAVGSIYIKRNVWIGNNVTILKNSEVGENSIVAAGAVVNGIFPDNVIIGGIPAKILKAI